MKHVQAALLSGLLGLCMGNFGCSTQPEYVHHPQAEFIPPLPQGAFSLIVEPPNPHAPDTSLAAADGEASIGTLGEPAMFGLIVDAETDASGRLAILDGYENTLRVFDSAGSLIATAGGRGSGPSEFRKPRAVSVGDAGSYLIFDGLGSVSKLVLQGDSLRYARQFGFRGDLFDGCASEGYAYLHGNKPDATGTIHVYTTDGEYIRSFGGWYDSPNPAVNHYFNKGLVSCLGRSVVHASSTLPYIVARDRNGTLLWSAEVDGFKALEVFDSPTEGVVRLGVEQPQYDMITSLEAERGGRFIFLQVTRFDRPSESMTMWSYKIDVESVTSIPLSRLNGRLLAVAGDGIWVTESAPYPVITRLSVSK